MNFANSVVYYYEEYPNIDLKTINLDKSQHDPKLILMKTMTQGQAEAEFTRTIVQFEKEYLGRGPVDARTFFVKDMILVRLKGLMTPAEKKLAESGDGRSLIKETRRQLFESSLPLLEEIVSSITGTSVISLHTDMSTKTGERIIVFTVDQDMTKLFR